MPKAPEVKCEGCSRWFKACRRDSLYCSEKCRSKVRRLDARINYPAIPKSGVPGVTFNRTNERWAVMVKLDYGWKYVGSEKELEKALQLQKEVMEA